MPHRYWVVNASPLIVLCKVNAEHLIIGTLGIILLARQSGLILSAAELLRELRNHQFRLDDRTIAQVLKETVGETWY